jgi:hypothetical protein
MSAARVFDFAAAFEILQGKHDPMRRIWDEQASSSDRRLLLSMARATASDAAAFGRREWSKLPANVRGDVVAGLARFKGWAERVAP